MPVYQNKENNLVNYNYFAKYTEQTKGNNYSPDYAGIASPEHFNCVSAMLAVVSEVKNMVFWPRLVKKNDRTILCILSLLDIICINEHYLYLSNKRWWFGCVLVGSVISLLLSFVAVLLSASLKEGRMPCLHSGGTEQQIQGYLPAKDIHWIPETRGVQGK